MTCIVGYVHKGTVHMGADSCGSNGHNYSIYTRPKLFKVNNRFLVGASGSFRLIDVLHYGFEPPKITEGFDRDRYMREEYIRALRTTAKSSGLDAGDNLPGQFMVGFDGSLYMIQTDYSVLPAPSHGGSVGSGAEAATAVLYHLRGSKQAPRSRLRSTLEAAEATICSVKGPFEFQAVGALDARIRA